MNLTIFDDSCPHIQQKVEVWMCWWTGREVVVAYFIVQILCNPKRDTKTILIDEDIDNVGVFGIYFKLLSQNLPKWNSPPSFIMAWFSAVIQIQYYQLPRQNIIKNNFCSTGGMQDYNYIFHGCMELTLEISCCKYPSAKELAKLWNDNRQVYMHLSSHHKFNK